MILTQRVQLAAILLSTLALVAGYVSSDVWIGAGLLAALGVLWGFGCLHNWRWISNLAMAGMAAVAAIGIELGVNSGLVLVSILSTLAAWDLDAFNHRLQGIRGDEKTLALEKSHLYRLSWVTGLGLLLAGAGLTLDWNAGFGIVFILSLLVAISFGRIIGFLKDQNV
jgi:uncharacterized membrane protein